MLPFKRLSNVTQSTFARAVAVLMGGTIFGQALSILALPLLTRLYTPEDFSVLAVYSALLGVLSIVSTLRLDVAIPMPKKSEDAANLLVLSVLFVLLTSSLVMALIWVIPYDVIAKSPISVLSSYLWMIPLGILLAGLYNALQFWAIRNKSFMLISHTRITQAVMAVSVQIGFGFWGLTPLGLLLGYICSNGGGVLGLGKDVWQKDKKSFSTVSFVNMKKTLYEYRRFPQYSTFEAFANSAAIQAPVIFIAALAIGPDAGYLMLAMRVMQAPMSLIGSSIAQVYLARAPEEYRKGNLHSFTVDVFGGLLKTGIGPIIFAGIVAPYIFPLIFGDTWSRAGILITWMTPWFLFQFLASPISMAIQVLGHQYLALLLQVFGLFLRLGFVIAASVYVKGSISEAYAVSGAVFYLVYLIIILKLTHIDAAVLFNEIKKSIYYILAWIAFGGVVSLLLIYFLRL